MGVVATWRPDLFRAVVADVPFVDVINTMLDASIPLTAQEWEQWGNPRNPAQYAYMKSYSPYDNVAAKEYPRPARHHLVQRLAGDVLGAGQVGGEAAGDEARVEPGLPADQLRGRARGVVGAVRPAEGAGLRVRVHGGRGEGQPGGRALRTRAAVVRDPRLGADSRSAS